jgi:hypothetical protein
LKLLQETTVKTLEVVGVRNNFMNRTLIAQGKRAWIDKWDCIKLKSFCTAKEKGTRMKRQSTDGIKPLPAIHLIGSY